MAVTRPSFVNTEWNLGNSFNAPGAWLSGKKSLRIVDMHYAGNVVAGQVDTLVMGNVVFDSAKTLSFGGVFIKLLEDNLLLFFSREARFFGARPE